MKTKTATIIPLVLLLTVLRLNGQNLPAADKGDRTLSIQLYGPELLGFHYNYFLDDRFSLNAGLGIFFNLHAGANYYFLNTSNVNIYAGSQICYITELSLDNIFSNYGGQPAIYFPVGMQYIADKGFTLGLEAGFNLFKDDYAQSNTSPFLFALKIGYTKKKNR